MRLALCGWLGCRWCAVGSCTVGSRTVGWCRLVRGRVVCRLGRVVRRLVRGLLVRALLHLQIASRHERKCQWEAHTGAHGGDEAKRVGMARTRMIGRLVRIYHALIRRK